MGMKHDGEVNSKIVKGVEASDMILNRHQPHIGKPWDSTILDKNVKEIDVTTSSFQDKALESTGNYKYSPHPPKKPMFKSGWIISLTLTKQL